MMCVCGGGEGGDSVIHFYKHLALPLYSLGETAAAPTSSLIANSLNDWLSQEEEEALPLLNISPTNNKISEDCLAVVEGNYRWNWRI